MAKILISGGTGLIGARLIEILTHEDNIIHVLTRQKKENTKTVKYFQWDINKGQIDVEALKVDHIIHLVGAGVMDKKWTDKRKQVIIDSRVKSTELIIDTLINNKIALKSFVSASAVGYYGDCSDKLLTEESALGDDYLAEVCHLWEARAKEVLKENLFPIAITRIGIVLSKSGGALPQLALPVKFGAGAYMGNGKQYYPWIHIEDLCRMFIYAMSQPLKGIYNAVAPNPVRNKQLVRAIAKATNRPFIPLPAPKAILKLAMGEMSSVLLNSQNVSSEKIVNEGFEFKYPYLEGALEEIY